MEVSIKDIEKYRDKLSVMNITKLAEAMNVNYRTLLEFSNGNTVMPNASLYIKLRKYFDEKD